MTAPAIHSGQHLVGRRVEEAAEGRLLVKAPRHVAVEKVRDAGDEKDDHRRPEAADFDPVKERHEQRDAQHRQPVRQRPQPPPRGGLRRQFARLNRCRRHARKRL
jgi:hypothetical protein